MNCTCPACSVKKCEWCGATDDNVLLWHMITYGCDSKGVGGTPFYLCDTCYAQMVQLGRSIKFNGQEAAQEH